jgi:hypothetical protein
MAAITNPGTKVTEFAGTYKLLAFNDLAITTSSDALTLSLADNGISSISSAIVGVSAGLDAAFSYFQVSFSGLVITVASFNKAGVVATDFTGTKVNLIVIGSS